MRGMNLAPQLHTRLWSLLDQVFFSAANFLLVVCLARYYSDIEVAGYGIGLSIALMIQSTQRTCYVVQNAVLAPGIFRRRAKSVLGQHLVAWGWILALEILLAALLLAFLDGEYAYAIVLSTFVCSLIYAQLDFDRIALTKHDRMKDALYASVIFLILCGALFFLIPAWGISYTATMLLVGLYAVLKILRLIMIIGRPDFIIGARLARRATQKYLFSSLLGVVGYTGHSHGPLFILGSVAAASHAAAFVAMRGLMQPLMVIIRSLDVIDKNLVQSESGKSFAALKAVLLRQVAIYGALSAAAILGSWLLGEWVIHLVYGHRYDDFIPLLTGWAVIFSLLAITFPIETVVVKLDRLKRYNSLRLVAGAAGLLLAVILCPPMGAMGAVWASISGWAACVACAGWIIRDVLLYKS